ncbi:MAG TPA: glycerol-3-phosphate 1-O-acyltransferase PlsY [Vicinamibacterales bacterium]|nr:glycerol-3-phosphate 1-O-acyltransferase PlsY [Vicinamibacterales bacterium]
MMAGLLTPVFLVLAGYLLGSIPFAFILGRAGGRDLRLEGSGNLGAANVFRTTGPGAGLVTLALDVAKGAAAVLLAFRFGAGEAAPAAAGVAAVLGHIYPVWLRFRGGKGVATACGVFSMLAPMALVPAILVFGATVWATRYVSLGSMLAAVSLPPLAYAVQSPIPTVAAAVIVAVLVVQRHRGNLTRLHAGTERRLGQRVAGQ